MIQDIGWLVMGLVLLIQSIWDIRYKEIPIMVTVIFGILGIIFTLFVKREWLDVLYALLPGLLSLGIGRVTKEAIGYGDGFLLCAMGMYISCEDVLAIVMMAIVIGGVFAFICLVLRRKSGKDQLPFVPFMFVAWVLFVLMEKGVMA